MCKFCPFRPISSASVGVFSASEWRGLCSAGPFFSALPEKNGEKRGAGERNSAVAPDKTIRSILRFVVSFPSSERPSGGPQNFCHLKILLRQIFLPAKSKNICSESMRGFQVLPVSAPQSLLIAEEKRVKQKGQKLENSARKRYSRPPASLFCILFSDKPEKSMPPEARPLPRKESGVEKRQRKPSVITLPSQLKKSFSFLLLDGCRSLRSALDSIWRMRSRVTSNSLPTSSRVWGLPS